MTGPAPKIFLVPVGSSLSYGTEEDYRRALAEADPLDRKTLKTLNYAAAYNPERAELLREGNEAAAEALKRLLMKQAAREALRELRRLRRKNRRLGSLDDLL